MITLSERQTQRIIAYIEKIEFAVPYIKTKEELCLER